MDFEQLFSDFKGKGSEELPKSEVVKFLTDLFDTALYKTLNPIKKENKIDKTYENNQQFWSDCLLNKLAIGKTIKFENFSLIEWLPYSPGLFYTERAKDARRQAKYMMNDSQNEYLPLGKAKMMLGGIGSVRLAPEKNKFYLNASSTGISHQGIPIITNRETYYTLIDQIKHEGYCTVDIVGTIEVLPIEKGRINYDREIPKYSVVATSIVKKPKIEAKILVSVSAIYSGNTNKYNLGKQWSFASFTPDSNEKELQKAVEWIEQYAKRYSEGKPKILSDFDEHKSHFSTDIEFKLEDIIKGNINEELLLKYSEKFQITINKNIIGDNIENNIGNIIKGNKGNVFVSNQGDINISNSFNKVKNKFGEDAAQLLTKVADIINKEGDNDTKELFSSFKEELEKEEPRKSILNTLWSSIAIAIPLIQYSAEIFDKVKIVFGF